MRMVSAKAMMTADVQKRVVSAVARVWAEGAPAVCGQYRMMNAGWIDAMHIGAKIADAMRRPRKATVKKIFFLIFLQSIHQVDMKNVVKCA